MFDNFKKTTSTIMPYVLSCKQSNWLKISTSFSMDLLTSAINVITPVLFQEYYMHTNNNTTLREEEVFGESIPMEYLVYGGFAGALLLAQVLPKLRNMLISRVRANVQKELSLSMLEKCYDLELDFHLTTRTGDFAQALSKNYSSIDKLIPSFFSEILPHTIETAGTAVLLNYRYGPIIGNFQPAIFILYNIIGTAGERLATQTRSECVRTSYQAYGVLIQSIQKYQLAHQFGNVQHEIDEVDKALKDSEAMFKKNHQADNNIALVLSILNSLSFVGGIAYLSYMVNLGELQVIDLAVITYFASRFQGNLESLAQALNNFNTAIADSQKLVDFLDRQSTVGNTFFAEELQLKAAPSIEFKNVSFSIDNKPILDNINFIVNEGEKLAIVGPTGAGKSTIIKLLLRFYRPDSGEILINGVDINEYTAESLRDCMTMVAQDAMLFNDTVTNNIQYGYLNGLGRDTRSAFFKSGLKDEEMLDREAGQSGALLSGGERQRVAIARSILKGGYIFLLDEPTSALDPQTEQLVQDTLDHLSNQVTSFLVTHRLNTVVNANYIVYLSDGIITEEGSYEELMATEGEFYEQFTVQCQKLGIEVSDMNVSSKHKSITYLEDDAPLVDAFWQRKNRETRTETVIPLYDSTDENTSLLSQRGYKSIN
jgi:ABC-type multidrug transport system fused ATPase/permease subunit